MRKTFSLAMRLLLAFFFIAALPAVVRAQLPDTAASDVRLNTDHVFEPLVPNPQPLLPFLLDFSPCIRLSFLRPQELLVRSVPWF